MILEATKNLAYAHFYAPDTATGYYTIFQNSFITKISPLEDIPRDITGDWIYISIRRSGIVSIQYRTDPYVNDLHRAKLL